MDLLWILGFFFIAVLIAFLVFAFFLPEWVGITGKAAKDVINHQQGVEGEEKKKDLLFPD